MPLRFSGWSGAILLVEIGGSVYGARGSSRCSREGRQLEIEAESDGYDDAVARLFGKPPRYKLSDEDGTVDLNNSLLVHPTTRSDLVVGEQVPSEQVPKLNNLDLSVWPRIVPGVKFRSY